MPKSKRARKPYRATAAANDLSDPHPMAGDPQPVETLTRSPPQEQDPVPPPQESPAVPDVPAPVPDVAAVPDPPFTAVRKAPGKRKKPLAGKKLAAVQEKLDLLRHNLHPIPFAPAPFPNLTRNEHLFRALGLWDFIHLNLPADPLRPDHLAQLIAYYDPLQRRSEVHGARVAVSRADLARALALPVKKAAPVDDDLLPLLAGEEAVAVIADFITDWLMVLEDACVLPGEVVAAVKLVKEGHPHKVDWAGLVWSMVEKELQEAPKSGQCHYASHIQRLIKHQRPHLFGGEADINMEPEPEPEPEPSMEVTLADEDDDTINDSSAVNTTSLEDFQDTNNDNSGPGLSLGLGDEVDVLLGLNNCTVEEDQPWLTGGNDASASHCLRPCSLNDVTAMECDDMSKEVEDRGGRPEDRYDEELAVNFSTLERLASTDLLQAMEGGNVSYNMSPHPLDPSSGDFLAMGADTHKDMAADPGPTSQFSFGNRCKRVIDEIDDDDNGDDVQQLMQGNQHKRMCSDRQWEGSALTFDACSEQVQYWMGKAKMIVVEKEHACANAQMELQYASNMLQQKDELIQALEKARMEDAHKRELEVSRFVHELRVMTRIIYGYKKALKETSDAFAEYSKKFPEGDEPLYKDVEGAGGLVLSTRELERLRLEKEEEMRLSAVQKIDDFGKLWLAKFTEIEELITDMAIKLKKRKEDFEFLKEHYAKTKVSETDTKVLEKQHLDKEELPPVAEQAINDFASRWSVKFTEYEELTANLEKKFMKHTEDFKLLKESYAKDSSIWINQYAGDILSP